MKTIYYQSLQTSANTNYRRISNQDLQWLLNNLRTLLDVLSVSRTSTDPELAQPSRHFDQPRNDLPRHGRGPQQYRRNSLTSFAEGVIENFDKHQRDPSDRTCAGLVQVFAEASKVFTCFEPVQFIEGRQCSLTSPKPQVPQTWRRVIDTEQGTITIEYTPKT